MDVDKKVSKLRKVVVHTPQGDKIITMAPLVVDNSKDLTELSCTNCCSYGKICGKIKHPEKPDSNNLVFTDWCVEKSFIDETMKEPTELSNYYPLEGELEKLYPEESSVFKQLIKGRQLIDISKFIDKVCSGFCDSYNPEHTNCTFSNTLCICKELFLGTLEPGIMNKDGEIIEKSETSSDN